MHSLYRMESAIPDRLRDQDYRLDLLIHLEFWLEGVDVCREQSWAMIVRAVANLVKIG